MFSSPTFHQFRNLQPEVIDLEAEYFEQAQQGSHIGLDESQQWQAYLNTLAYIGFIQWMRRFLDQFSSGNSHNAPAHDVAFLSGEASLCQVGDFRFCLLTMEHILHDTVRIPQCTIHDPSLIPHFFVIIEILEEQAQISLSGFFRYDKLLRYLEQNHQSTMNDSYVLPLSAFDIELNHLLLDYRYLDANLIVQPISSPQTENKIVADNDSNPPYLKSAITQLSQWLEGFFENEWHAFDDLLDPEMALAFNTRSYEMGAQRGKLIDLGLQLKEQVVALLINIFPEAENKLMILVQLHPATGERYLSADIKLMLLSKAGKILQEVKARSYDNYIQLKPFVGELGKSFSLVCSYYDVSHQEDFVL
jgi:Protein of unknown function (DUF1822)